MSRKEVPRAGLVRAALAGRITNEQGATALRLSVRQFQRRKRRFRHGGAPALLHRARGQPSRRRLPAAVRQQVAELVRTTYAGFNDCHLTEKLQELHRLPLSRSSVRRLRRALGLPPKHRRRPGRHRTRRTPEAQRGALVQLDGSPFDWLEGRGPEMTLLGAIDDTTSTVLALSFRPAEDLHGYTTLLRQLGLLYGLPLALYGDRLKKIVQTPGRQVVGVPEGAEKTNAPERGCKPGPMPDSFRSRFPSTPRSAGPDRSCRTGAF